MKKVLFDFNGTLFFDSDINYIAWKQTIRELAGDKIDFEQVYPQYRSVRNEVFIAAVFRSLGLPEDPEAVRYWAKRKETEYYQKYCRNNRRDQLAPGAADLLDHLKERNVPINLCTASIRENVDFYFSYLGLDRWFDIEKVAFDDGTFINKVEMYRSAAERIGADIQDCLVFEDSPRSIQEAILAGCQNIVAIRGEDTPDQKEIIQKIRDFTEFDRELLK